MDSAGWKGAPADGAAVHLFLTLQEEMRMHQTFCCWFTKRWHQMEPMGHNKPCAHYVIFVTHLYKEVHGAQWHRLCGQLTFLSHSHLGFISFYCETRKQTNSLRGSRWRFSSVCVKRLKLDVRARKDDGHVFRTVYVWTQLSLSWRLLFTCLHVCLHNVYILWCFVYGSFSSRVGLGLQLSSTFVLDHFLFNLTSFMFEKLLWWTHEFWLCLSCHSFCPFFLWYHFIFMIFRFSFIQSPVSCSVLFPAGPCLWTFETPTR